MKRFSALTWSIALAILLLITVPALALAQPGDGYDLTWSTIDGGGSTFSTGGGYSLGSTAGQPDASAVQSGGGYSLVGGFWGGSAALLYHVYLPLVLR